MPSSAQPPKVAIKVPRSWGVRPRIQGRSRTGLAIAGSEALMGGSGGSLTPEWGESYTHFAAFGASGGLVGPTRLAAYVPEAFVNQKRWAVVFSPRAILIIAGRSATKFISCANQSTTVPMGWQLTVRI